jgi:predicted transport protein
MPLFQIQSDGRTLRQVSRREFANEAELHSLVEANLQDLLGINLIASEYPIPNGRIDTLGLDENGSPVIIEYKWKKELSAVVQGLFYLDWVLKNRRPFESIVRDKLGKDVEVDWSSQPRLIIVAQDFDVKELAAINQMGPSIELIKYSVYDGLFSYEILNLVESRPAARKTGSDAAPVEHSLEDLINKTTPPIQEMFVSLRDKILDLSEAVWESVHPGYCDYRTVSTFVTVTPQKERLKIFIKLGEAKLDDPRQIAEQIPKSWGYGLLNKQFVISDIDETEYAMSLIQQAHDYVSN